MNSRGWPWGKLLLLAALLLLAFATSLACGAVDVPLRETWRYLSGGGGSAQVQVILHDLRLPKAITALLAGAALAVSGLQMQTLFRNPLADPFILGLHAGSSLGVALVLLGGGGVILGAGSVLGNLSLVGAATLGAAVVLLLVLAVARRASNPATTLIVGLMAGHATGGLVTVLVHFSRLERLRAFMTWTAGSFGGVTWQQLGTFAPAVLLSLVAVTLLLKPLNALLLGEGYAATMGLRVRRARAGIIVCAALLAGSVTAYCGPIGFLGVAVPHFCRGLLRTADHRVLLPACALLGATLALLADVVAQLPGEGQVLPLNAVTSLIGAPVVTWVVLRGMRREGDGA
ncbi:MAG: iron ABC transporter permease [Fimbriimonadaceae bacterium]|nr:iron ABC transporter permease [Fimbriimonadaceae bacterium]